MSQRFAVVILAAGGSSRLGRPKQLLPYLGKTLVEHAARTAIASGAHEVVVVVGAESDAVREKLSGLPVRIVRNRDWQTGMGSSIRCGVESLSSHVDSVVISLCDQPQITPDLLRNLASKAATSSSSIAASSYDGVLGAPSAFGKELFKELTSLAGDSGARDIIRNATQQIERVEFSGGNVDIDTPQEYQQLVQSKVVGSLQSVELDEQEARAPPVV